MQPLALILNITIVVGIIGIVVYWVRRFAVFLGYKAIAPDILKIAELLKAQPLRDRSDVVLEGRYGGNPTIIRFSHRVDTPGLDIQMRVPAAISFFLLPKNFAARNEGRVLMRTGSAPLDKRFDARTDHPMEFKMLTAGAPIKASLEQLCCSTQTGLTIRDRVIELSELTIPPFTANHVFDHLQSMLTLAKVIHDMPGADRIKVDPLPRRGQQLAGEDGAGWRAGLSSGAAFHAALQSRAGCECECSCAAFRSGAGRCDEAATIARMARGHKR